MEGNNSSTAVPINATTVQPAATTKVYENAGPVTLLFFFGVVGNVIALSVLCCSSKTHKWRPFYRFVCGLAISDGGGILASYPFAEYRYISKFEYLFPTPLCEYLGFVFMFTLMSSAMIVCCMSFDRFFATFYPFLYNSPTKGLRTNIILAVVWCLSGILSSLHLYGLGSSKNIYPGSWCFLNFIELNSTYPNYRENTIYSYIYASVGVLVVLMTLVINMAVVSFFVRNRLTKKRASKKRDIHVIAFLIVIVTVFTSCWAPLMVNILQHASGSIEGEGFTELTVLRMAVTNSVVDPWIYILFRKEVLMIILRAIERVRGRSLQITHDLSEISETADTKQVSTVMSSTNRTAESQLSDDDGGVYKG